MDTITIPKNFVQDDLVIVARTEYERLLRLRDATAPRAGEAVAEDDILQWSKEAQEMKKRGELPILNSLDDLD